ncbi:MAG: SDR family NAD(P)-dependent oxidoreductase [Deltaproteobacteria bacterium]|nr:SDR family NAD(P)-dependent oxidoreductase [Deltaproteobacteria bacterium]
MLDRNVRDRVVVITGASAGIGAALAAEVAARGGRPVLVARREDALAKACARCGDQALAVVGDVTRRVDHERVRDAAIARFGHIDAWVKNAGRGITRPVSSLTDEDFDEMMLVNVKSALYGAQAILPHFRSRGAGHLVAVSSMLGRVPFAVVRSAYSAAKHALNALMANLRMELATSDPTLHVTCVHPGVVATEFGNNALHGGPDSRHLPNAQSVDEVAGVIADALERPQADVYTRPGARQMVVDYYAAPDMEIAEQAFSMGPPRRATPTFTPPR